MTRVEIKFQGRAYTLTDETQASAPVLLSSKGEAYDPWDTVIENQNARMSGGERYIWQMTARAIAAYAIDDHPDDAAVADLLRAYNAVPSPSPKQRNP